MQSTAITCIMLVSEEVADIRFRSNLADASGCDLEEIVYFSTATIRIFMLTGWQSSRIC